MLEGCWSSSLAGPAGWWAALVVVVVPNTRMGSDLSAIIPNTR